MPLYALYYIQRCGYNDRVLPGLSVSLFTALTKSAAIRENSSSAETNKQAVMVAMAINKCDYDNSIHTDEGSRKLPKRLVFERKSLVGDFHKRTLSDATQPDKLLQQYSQFGRDNLTHRLPTTGCNNTHTHTLLTQQAVEP